MNQTFEGVLVETRKQRGRSYGGGVSMKVGGGLRIYSGSSTYVPGPEVPTIIDRGTIILDDEGIRFVGKSKTKVWQWANVLDLVRAGTVRGEARSLAYEVVNIPVSNRQTISGLGVSSANYPTLMAAIKEAVAGKSEYCEPYAQEAADIAFKTAYTASLRQAKEQEEQDLLDWYYREEEKKAKRKEVVRKIFRR